jgi:hypothetical protein
VSAYERATHLGEATESRHLLLKPLATRVGEVRRLLGRKSERLELRRVAELVLNELLRRLGLVLDRLVRLADLLKLGIHLLDDLSWRLGRVRRCRITNLKP